MGPKFAKTVFQLVHQYPFTLSLDGSNDKEEQKLVPLTVRVFDNDLGMVQSKFLSMCLCNQGTAATCFEKVEEVFISHNIPWPNCIALSVDSASVNIGRYNSIKTRLEVKNPSVYTLGCPCHFIHNTAHAASKKLEGASGFDVEELAFTTTVAVKKKLTFRSVKTIAAPSCVIVFALSSARGVSRICAIIVYFQPFLRTRICASVCTISPDRSRVRSVSVRVIMAYSTYKKQRILYLYSQGYRLFS